MTTLILNDWEGHPYSVEAIQVKPAGSERLVSTNPNVPTQYTLTRAASGLNIILAQVRTIEFTGTQNSTSNKTLSIPGITFEQYADILTKSPNGVVDLRPLMAARQKEKGKAPQPA